MLNNEYVGVDNAINAIRFDVKTTYTKKKN